MQILRGVKKAIFGYDIFISYSRRDSLDYAYAISKYFMNKGYDCYLDQLSSISPGKELPKSIKNAITKSTAFILIGSEGAKLSEPIKNEISHFIEYNENKPIIPITIDGAINYTASWFHLINGLALIEDSSSNLLTGQPAQGVLHRIEDSLNFTRKSKKLKYIAAATITSVLIITAAAILFTGYEVKKAELRLNAANEEATNAIKNAEEEKRIASMAKAESAQALDEKYKAEKTKDSINKIALNLSKQIKTKDAALKESNDLYVNQLNSAKEMLLEFNYATDAISFSKKYDSKKNLVINAGELILFPSFKTDQVHWLSSEHIAFLSKFATEWHNSTNKPDIIISGFHTGYLLDERRERIISVSGLESPYERTIALSKVIIDPVYEFLIYEKIPSNKISWRSYGDRKKLTKGIALFNTRVEISTK